MWYRRLIFVTGSLMVLGIVSAQASAQTLTTLYSFDDAHGSYPLGSLILSGSTLYGTTSDGGTNGCGTVFSVPVTGGTPTVLYSFDRTHGSYPEGSLILSGSTLYGMTSWGGNMNFERGHGRWHDFQHPRDRRHADGAVLV